jgi:hypothetical protein
VGAAKPLGNGSGGDSGGEGGGVLSPVAVERETVDHERVAEEVEKLAVVAEAVGAAVNRRLVCEVPVGAG